MYLERMNFLPAIKGEYLNPNQYHEDGHPLARYEALLIIQI